ncbi:ParA family protein [Nocardia salmonicida]|uniref:ParA family protein n=1 Tax=Nocardia salmonicida TaxID=53431 RepID=UPI0007A520F7|nr:ParA family protein [Nocardia salmonicida]
MTRAIAIALQKGGVGKTTTTINLGAQLAALGRKVLLIDMDQQAHTTKGLGVTLGADDATMYEVLHPERDMRVPLAEIIRSTEWGVDVAPAHLAMRKHERSGLGSGGQLRLARQLDELDGYDYVLLDCPPALGELTAAALAAADDVLAVLKAGSDEVDGLIELGNSVDDAQETFNGDLEIRYVLLTDFDGQPVASRNVRDLLIRDWGEWKDGGAYIGEIPHTVRVVEAKGLQIPIHIHAPTSSAAVAYKDAARRLDERINAS